MTWAYQGIEVSMEFFDDFGIVIALAWQYKWGTQNDALFLGISLLSHFRERFGQLAGFHFELGARPSGLKFLSLANTNLSISKPSSRIFTHRKQDFVFAGCFDVKEQLHGHAGVDLRRPLLALPCPMIFFDRLPTFARFRPLAVEPNMHAIVFRTC